MVGAMRKVRTTTTSLSKALLNEDQRGKFVLESEGLDLRGIVSRNRVVNQTIYDVMFLEELIERAQHEAADCFADSLCKSGCSVGSVNLESLSHTPAYKVGAKISERRMAFSSAYRFVVGECGEDLADRLMRVIDKPYSFPRYNPDQLKYVRCVSDLLQDTLWSLASYYCTDSIVDPRKVIRNRI